MDDTLFYNLKWILLLRAYFRFRKTQTCKLNAQKNLASSPKELLTHEFLVYGAEDCFGTITFLFVVRLRKRMKITSTAKTAIITTATAIRGMVSEGEL